MASIADVNLAEGYTERTALNTLPFPLGSRLLTQLNIICELR